MSTIVADAVNTKLNNSNNKNSLFLLAAGYVLGTMLNALHTLPPLILTIAL